MLKVALQRLLKPEGLFENVLLLLHENQKHSRILRHWDLQAQNGTQHWYVVEIGVCVGGELYFHCWEKV